MLQGRNIVPRLRPSMAMTAKQLRAVLKSLGLSQLEAARRLGVTGRAVRFWVAGERRIPEPVAILLRTWAKSTKPHA